MECINERKKLMYLLIVIFTVVLLGTTIISNDSIADRYKILRNLDRIEYECNYVYIDIEKSEEMYKELLNKESDTFKVAVFSSALARVYTVKNNYEKAIKYSNKAIENYESLENGNHYSIAEKKYMTWGLLRMGRYGECFRLSNSILKTISESDEKLYTKEQIMDTEALINSMFLIIFSEYKIIDKAKTYYDKLCNMDITLEYEVSRGDKISFSKMQYAKALNNPELMKKYADECYAISIKRDYEYGTNLASSVVLDVAKANIEIEKYDDVINLIQDAEEFYSEIKDYVELGEVYLTYAKYYQEIDEVELANQYYIKSLLNKYEYNYDNKENIKKTLEQYIVFLQDNNLGEGKEQNKLYEEFYKLIEVSIVNTGLDNLLSEILYINDEMAYSRMNIIENETNQNRYRTNFSILVIGILILVTGIMTVLITRKNFVKNRLEEIGRKDYLTKVNTRIYGEKLILQLINDNIKFSIAVIDIDNFKMINDNYGHLFGDRVLKTLAIALTEKLDQQDIIIRFGGEEFIIVFIENNKNIASLKLEKVREYINDIVFENNVQISFSGGIKEWDNTDVTKVIEEADKLLYKAKNQGKNRVCF